MKCIYCQAEMKRGTAPLHVDGKGIHLSLDEVPAWICPQCGEVLFEEEEVEALQSLVRSIEEKAGKLSKTA